ncbi:MAG: DUF418 domain-containing protein [Pyrinomonadaceae bacterium]|nr:DUF418 domain-containing protein [Pyrinomonadaceae bacterium]
MSSISSSRVDALDALRGFALFGILVVNLPFLAHPIYNFAVQSVAANSADKIFEWLISFGFELKFYVLFSFLFGYGLALQLARADERGENLAPRYFRRLFGLFVLGAIHAVFLFFGDILIGYAILGCLLWLVRDWQPRSLLKLSGGLLCLAAMTNIGLVLLANAMPESEAETLLLAEDARRAYLGTFSSSVEQRIQDWTIAFVFISLVNFSTALSIFALGLAAGKTRFFENFARHRKIVNRILPFALAIGVVGNFAFASFLGNGFVLIDAAAFGLTAFAAPALTFCYIVVVLKLHERFAGLFAPVRAAGKMSLTNYMLQSVICGFIFNGYGLGWYDQIGTTTGFALAAGIFVFQLFLSVWWLNRFRFGPDEWLLRSWTHLKWQRWQVNNK